MKKILSSVLMLSIFVPVFAFASFDTTLKYGSHGSAVMDLQNFLQSQGVFSGKVDGSFGSGTRKAIIAFQVANGLQADGSFGPKTRAVANNLLNKTLTTQSSSSSTLPAGCTLTTTFSTVSGQSCLVANTQIIQNNALAIGNQILNNPISTSIDYSSFSKIQMSQYANNPSVYKGQKVEFASSVLAFLPKGGSGGDTNYISLLDPIANVKVMAEVDDTNAYTNLVNKVKAGDTFRVYGIGTVSQNFTNTYGATVTISVVKLSAADDCDEGSSVTNLTSDSSPYGWTCAGTMQHVMP